MGKKPKMIECPTCNGEKEVMISCCTQEIIHDDIDRCPECYEGLGDEECPECEGTGEVPEDHEQEYEVSSGLQAQGERLHDQMQERGLLGKNKKS